MTWTPVRLRAVSIVVWLVVWEFSARWFMNSEFVSPPSKVLAAFPHLFADRNLDAAVGEFCAVLAIAFTIAIVLGTIVGLIVGSTRFTYRTLFPIVLLIYAIPQITVLPVFVLTFGIGTASKIAFGASHGIFPIILNVVGGMKAAPPQHVLSARTMGASPLQIVRRVLLPQLVPALFAGMRVSIAITLIGVVLAELYVSQNGIGYFTQNFSERFDPSDLFGLVAILAVIAIVLSETAHRLELHFNRWR
jgi:ABC-type nitrate/sulfonate/bicarbonate transport system permease component